VAAVPGSNLPAKIFIGVAITVIGGGFLAGFSGLVIAGGMQADVKTLKVNAARREARIQSMVEDVSAIKANVQTLQEDLSEQRREQREDVRRVHDKLDVLLQELSSQGDV